MANAVEGTKIPVVGMDITCTVSSTLQPWVVVDASYDPTPPIIEVVDVDGTPVGRVAYNTARCKKLSLDIIVTGQSTGANEAGAASANTTALTTGLAQFAQVLIASPSSKAAHLAGTWSVQSAKAKSSNTGMQTWALELLPSIS
jgi:hypothetical protein